jgi:MFS transporter, DHA1 family, multidrug resistance protein
LSKHRKSIRLSAHFFTKNGFESFLSIGVSSSSSALVADSSEFKRLGAGMGMQGTIGDIGHASGPLLAGFLIAHLHYANAFVIIAGLQLVAAAVFWITMRRT